MSASFESALVAAVARSSAPRPVQLDVDAGVAAVFRQDVFVDGARIEMFVEHACAVIFGRPEEGTVQIYPLLRPVFRHLQVLTNEPKGHRMQRDVANLAALALDAQVHQPFASLHIPQPQQAQFLAPNAVIKEGGENGPVPYTLQCVGGRGIQQNGVRLRQYRQLVPMPTRGIKSFATTPKFI
jgi:hypothetical protein